MSNTLKSNPLTCLTFLALTETLRAEFSGSKPNLDKCNELLQKLKLVLAETSLLAPLFAPPSVSQQDQLLASNYKNIHFLKEKRLKLELVSL
jgi:hypothetical protein